MSLKNLTEPVEPVEARMESVTHRMADSPDVIEEAELRDLAGYWAGKRQDGNLPSRRSIDPIEIGWALNRIYITERVEDPTRWRYVLAGEQIEQAFRRNSLRGIGLDEILSPEAFRTVCLRWQPLDEGRAVYMRGQIYKAADRYVPGARLMLPLSDDGARVTGMIGMSLTYFGDSPVANVPLQLWSIAL